LFIAQSPSFECPDFLDVKVIIDKFIFLSMDTSPVFTPLMDTNSEYYQSQNVINVYS